MNKFSSVKEIRDLVKFLKGEGYIAEMRSGGHIAVQDPDGILNSVIIPSTPSDYRSFYNTLAQLKRAGYRVPEKTHKPKSKRQIPIQKNIILPKWATMVGKLNMAFLWMEDKNKKYQKIFSIIQSHVYSNITLKDLVYVIRVMDSDSNYIISRLSKEEALIILDMMQGPEQKTAFKVSDLLNHAKDIVNNEITMDEISFVLRSIEADGTITLEEENGEQYIHMMNTNPPAEANKLIYSLVKLGNKYDTLSLFKQGSENLSLLETYLIYLEKLQNIS